MNYALRIVHQIGGYEMDKFFNIGVDIKNERIKVLEGIFTGDGVRMRLTLSDNGKRIDFTGAQIIRLTVRKGDYKTVETVELLKEIQAAEAENGIIEIILPESFVRDKGMHQLQAALIGADGQISCARVNYIVSLAGEDAEASGEDLQTCGQLLKKASAALDAENVRVTAEAARQTAEDLRAAAEAERKTAENGREAAETERAGNETARKNAEAARAAAEKSRAAAETAREGAEANRETSETAREGAEASRETAEAARQAAEEGRETSETVREIEEEARAAAETERANAETARESAEKSRAAAETNRGYKEIDRGNRELQRKSAETTRTNNETARKNAETERANAEAARSAAETARAAAETERSAAENEREAAETERAAAITGMFEKLCPTGSAESLTSSLTLADCCGGTNIRNYVIHGAEGGVGRSKNLAHADVSVTAADIMNPSAQSSSLTASGSEIVIDSPEENTLELNYSEDFAVTLSPGSYCLSYRYINGTLTGVSEDSGGIMWLGLKNEDGAWITCNMLKGVGIKTDNYNAAGNRSVLYTITSETKCSIAFSGSCTADNLKFVYQLESGSEVTDYEPYGHKIPVTVRGKNLISISRDIQSLTSGVVVEKGKDYVIAQMRASAENAEPGTPNSSSGWIGINTLKATAEAFNKCFFKDIKPSTTYTLSYDLEYFYLPGGLTSVKHRGQISISGKAEYTNAYVTEAGKKYHYKLTFTTPETITQIMFFFTLNSCKVKLSNIMLEEGGSETDYERYAEPQTAVIELSAPLGKNDHVVNASGTTFKNSVLSKASTAEIPLVASGTNTIEVGTATAPGKIEVEYYKDINKIVNNLTNAILAQGGNV